MAKLNEFTSPALETSKKLNCWEYKKCERQPGGQKVAELGICPATISQELDGAHGGKNAGRACWVVAGSLCGGKIQGTYAMKLHNCWRCEFMNSVKREEEEQKAFSFSHTRLGIERTQEKRQSSSDIATNDASFAGKRH